ncbi:MAG: hypothetical protein J6J36_00995 [Clostridia bacterium]|nr:hypothetical protein [Clostridia bacterium]
MNEKEVKECIKNIKKAISIDFKNASDRKTKSEIKKNAYKRFDVIYERYGQEAYHKFVPSKYRKKDVKQLLKEQRFLSIYNKHGKREYNSHLVDMRAQDIKYESGSRIKKFAYLMKNFLKTGAFSTAATIALGFPPAAMLNASNTAKRELKMYEVEIEEYLNDIEAYGKEVKKNNFSDLENVMYIMDDMWQGTLGYGEPSLDLNSYPGLDLADSNGYGVCRNMADDFARKLNAIDDKYNARVINVYAQGQQYNFPDIERSEYTPEDATQDNSHDNSTMADFITKAFGNHAVVIFHSIEDDVELVADPTNPGVGIFRNGEIVMFNSYGEEPRINEYRPMTAMIYGADKLAEVPENYIQGIGIYTKEKMKALNDKYCVESQNNALHKTRSKKIVSFYDSIRVDTSTTDLNYKGLDSVNVQDKKEEREEMDDEIR